MTDYSGRRTNFVAADIALAGVALSTCARHGSSGQGIVDFAVSIFSTWLDGKARILAVSVQTSLLARTILIAFAAYIYHGRSNYQSEKKLGTGTMKWRLRKVLLFVHPLT